MTGETPTEETEEKMTGETPEVRSNKRKPREVRQNHRYHGFHRYKGPGKKKYGTIWECRTDFLYFLTTENSFAGS